MNTGLVGLIVALNLCERVSAYGFVLTNDASYYDDKHSTMVRLPLCRMCPYACVRLCACMHMCLCVQ